MYNEFDQETQKKLNLNIYIPKSFQIMSHHKDSKFTFVLSVSNLTLF